MSDQGRTSDSRSKIVLLAGPQLEWLMSPGDKGKLAARNGNHPDLPGRGILEQAEPSSLRYRGGKTLCPRIVIGTEPSTYVERCRRCFDGNWSPQAGGCLYGVWNCHDESASLFNPNQSRQARAALPRTPKTNDFLRQSNMARTACAKAGLVEVLLEGSDVFQFPDR